MSLTAGLTTSCSKGAGAATRALRPALAGAAALAAAGCFASRNDVRLLQAEVAAARVEALRADTARTAQLDALAAAVRRADEAARAAAARSARFEGDAREQLRSVSEQLIQVQELTGQSQRRLQDLRASLEARDDRPAPAAPPPNTAPNAASNDVSVPAPSGAPNSTPNSSPPADAAPAESAAARPVARPAPGAPGPNELYRLATEQYRRGSYASARAGFEELLRRYPTADVAADAQYYLAETFAGERKPDAADTAYAAVVTRYPQSSRAPTALYKRARARLAAGRRAEARTLFDEVVRRYPRSDEAALAREQLRDLPRAGA